MRINPEDTPSIWPERTRDFEKIREEMGEMDYEF